MWFIGPDRGADLGAAAVDPRHRGVSGAAAVPRGRRLGRLAALKRSWRDRDIREEVLVWDDLIRLERHEPATRPATGRRTAWSAWHCTRGADRVPQYLTLQGGNREGGTGRVPDPARTRRPEGHAGTGVTAPELGATEKSGAACGTRPAFPALLGAYLRRFQIGHRRRLTTPPAPCPTPACLSAR